MITRTQRTIANGTAVAAIVIAANVSSGGYFSQSWGWIALAFLVPSTVLLILERVTAPGRLRIAFASLVAAFGVWVALSTIWSISPAASGREVERVLVYVSLALAVALVLRRGDGASIGGGAFVGITAVTGYGLATRLFPDRFDRATDVFNATRLAEPLGYWNAFGLLTALGTILAVAIVAHARRSWAAAIAGGSVPLLVVALYLSFSRGSWAALFFGLVVSLALDPRRITVLWSLLVLAPATAIGVGVASRQDALTGDDVPAAEVARDGHRVAWMLAVLIVVSALLGWLAHRLARATTASPPVRRAFAIALGTCAAVVVVAAVAIGGGPSSALTELRERFEAENTAEASLNDRLFKIAGNGRQDTIAVAWDQGVARPIGGTGAGTFEIVWYEKRPSTLVVRDAHALFVETFAELGVVGLALLIAGLVVPLLAAMRARRSRYVAPAAGAYLAWLAASALDWHWEMVGVTMTALLIGSVGLVSAERREGGTLVSGTRLALVGVTATLSVLAVWSLVGNQALFAARKELGRKEWSRANDDARRARALLFWSIEPDLVLGDAKARLGDRQGALDAYRDGVEQDPRSWTAWLRYAQVTDGAESDAAYDRVRELNPRVMGLPGE